MRDFRKLQVWERSHRLTLMVYRLTSRFPKDELHGLTSQLRRASASIPANIAEGCGRSGSAELARYLHIAMGSASEVEYFLILAHDLEMCGETEYVELSAGITEIKRMLTSLIQKITT